jgi:hypothetical protein
VTKTTTCPDRYSWLEVIEAIHDRSHESPVATLQLCMSSHRFGVIIV